jgi:iron complex transport system substrate-binding protein
MLTAIGKSEYTVGVSGIDFISDEYVSNNRDKVRDVGYDNNIDYETLLALAPDIVLLYGVNAASAMEVKLQELGIPYIYIGEYVESSPLGKAEWVVAIAEIAGCREEGEKFFGEIPTRYNHLKELAASATSKPKVMLNTPYADSWFMPSVRSYAVQLIADAGAEYIYSQNKSHQSTPISLEQALLLASAADVWINVGNIASLAQLKSENPRFATIPSVTSGRVYNNTKRTNNAGGSDFWESGALNADIVLNDMIKLLHHNAPTDSLHYYKRLE